MRKKNWINLFGIAFCLTLFSGQAVAADCCTETLRRLDNIIKAVQDNTAANNRENKTLAEQSQREADYLASQLSELLKQQSKTDALLNYPPPTDYQCAVATLDQTDAVRSAKGVEAMDRIEVALTSAIATDANSGNQIYQRRIFNAACKLGAIGNQETDRHGKSCDTAADDKLKDRDISLARLTNDPCVPLDPPKVAQEFAKITTQDNYSGGTDANLKEAVLTTILFHRYMRTDQDRFPKNAAFVNARGSYNAAIMTDSMARRYAGRGALLATFDYHACYAKSFANGCDKGEQEARQYFNLRGITNSIDLPPSGYCLSQYQLDVAKIIMEEEELKNYRPGGSELQVIAASNLRRNITDLKQKMAAIDQAAAAAVNAQAADISNTSSSRPVSANSSHELIDAIKTLTRALKGQQGLDGGKALSVGAPTNDTHKKPTKRHLHVDRAALLNVAPPAPNAPTAFDVLPPLSSNYPVLAD